MRKRPFLDDFLAEVGKLFEVCVFTASAKVYASRVLRRLDPKRNLIRCVSTHVCAIVCFVDVIIVYRHLLFLTLCLTLSYADIDCTAMHVCLWRTGHSSRTCECLVVIWHRRLLSTIHRRHSVIMCVHTCVSVIGHFVLVHVCCVLVIVSDMRFVLCLMCVLFCVSCSWTMVFLSAVGTVTDQIAS